VRYAADTLKQPIAAFVAGTGTGGTLMGAGRRIRKEYPSSKIVAVEPAESTAMSNPNNLGEHQISGIGDGFIPEIVQMSEVSRIAVISSRDAIGRTRELHRAGLHVGISSGANVLAAERYIQDVNPDGVVFTVLPDSANRYERLLSDYR
jgi:cysteine synthase A